MKESKKYDVVGIGSPLLDFIVCVDDGDLARIDLVKGERHEIGHEQSAMILNELEKHTITTAPGGSSANTLATVGALGGKAVFMGKIGADDHGTIYEQKTGDDGVLARLSQHGDAVTGHAITFITPDGERTFATHLGASLHFKKDDVFDDDIAMSTLLHLEAFQLDDDNLKESAMHALRVARARDTKVSLDLSDPALIKRNLAILRDVVSTHVSIVFANEEEAKAFTGKQGKEALEEIAEMCDVGVVKLGGKGSLIKAGGVVHEVSTNSVTMANTNGAGDTYAGALLYGVTHGFSTAKAGKIASFASAMVVSGESARLDSEQRQKVREYIQKIS